MLDFNRLLKRTIKTQITIIKYSGALYLIFYSLFFAMIVFNKGEQSNISLNITLGQSLVFFLSFMFFVISLLSLNYYRSLSKSIRKTMLIISLLKIAIFFVMPTTLKISLTYRTWAFIVVLIIVIITSISDYYVVNRISKYYQGMEEKDLFVLLYGEPIKNVVISEEEIVETKKYISKQKMYYFILMFILVNHFVYRNPIVLLLFYIFSYAIIVGITYSNYRHKKEISPPIKLLIISLFLFFVLYGVYIISLPIDDFNSEDIRLLTITIVLPFLLHYHNIEKNITYCF